MNDISVIGLGAMGAAIARTLLLNGRKVTVWNRSPDKMAALASAGADTAEDIREAVSAGINSELPALWLDWVRRAQAAGYGSQETAAVIKELRKAD